VSGKYCNNKINSSLQHHNSTDCKKFFSSDYHSMKKRLEKTTT